MGRGGAVPRVGAESAGLQSFRRALPRRRFFEAGALTGCPWALGSVCDWTLPSAVSLAHRPVRRQPQLPPPSRRGRAAVQRQGADARRRGMPGRSGCSGRPALARPQPVQAASDRRGVSDFDLVTVICGTGASASSAGCLKDHNDAWLSVIWGEGRFCSHKWLSLEGPCPAREFQRRFPPTRRRSPENQPCRPYYSQKASASAPKVVLACRVAKRRRSARVQLQMTQQLSPLLIENCSQQCATHLRQSSGAGSMSGFPDLSIMSRHLTS